MPINTDNDAPQEAEKLPPGTHRVKIARILTAKRGGTGFKNKSDGSRKILMVLEDEAFREAMYDAPVEGRALWKMNALLKACGHQSETMNNAGVEYVDFLDQKIAEQWLLHHVINIEIEDRTNDAGQTFTDVRIVNQKKSAPPTPTADDDIPF